MLIWSGTVAQFVPHPLAKPADYLAPAVAADLAFTEVSHFFCYSTLAVVFNSRHVREHEEFGCYIPGSAGPEDCGEFIDRLLPGFLRRSDSISLGLLPTCDQPS